MTPEQIKSTADAMLAHLDGEPVQYCGNITGEWVDSNSPSFNCIEGHYRRKPKPAVRKWSKEDDVPGPICWLKFANPNWGHCLVQCFNDQGVFVYRYDTARVDFMDWHELKIGDAMHSTDRKTWHKCEVTE